MEAEIRAARDSVETFVGAPFTNGRRRPTYFRRRFEPTTAMDEDGASFMR